MKEEWAFIRGFKNKYDVSTFGRVRSIGRIITSGRSYKNFRATKTFIMKLKLRNDGYLSVSLCRNGSRKSYAVHRLVAKAFIPNPSNKSQVNHKDGVRSNCRVNNLEWSTVSENHKHSFAKLNRKKPQVWLGKKGFDNFNSKAVLQFTLDNKFVALHGSAMLAASAVGCSSHSRIAKVCRDQNGTTSRNHRWIYESDYLQGFGIEAESKKKKNKRSIHYTGFIAEPFNSLFCSKISAKIIKRGNHSYAVNEVDCKLCLSKLGSDNRQTLASLPNVVKQAVDGHKLVITRHVGDDNGDDGE